MYVLGGKDSEQTNIKRYNKDVSWCQRLDVFSLKWQDLPDLQESRSDPGSFETKDGKYLYVFLGGRKTIEILNLQNTDLGWKYIEVQLPERIWNINLTMFPLFDIEKTTQILVLQNYKVLMFGGNDKVIWQFNTLHNEVVYTPQLTSQQQSCLQDKDHFQL